MSETSNAAGDPRQVLDESDAAGATSGNPYEVELAAAHKRIDELARAYQAVEKDKEEFKHRLTRERERLVDVERANVAQSLLEVLDELDLCLASADDSPLARGVGMIRSSLLKKLDASGLERVSLLGKPYDANLAEAVDLEVTSNPADDQKVVLEIRAAYRLKDRVIRPGRVKVARYVVPAQA